MKKIAILGSTGSIGTQSLEVAREQKHKVVALSANNNIELLKKQIEEFKPELVCVTNKEKAQELEKKVNVAVLSQEEGMQKLARESNYDSIITAVVGSVGLNPTIEAIKRGKRVCLANKETLVMAGDIVMSLSQKHNAEIIPVDSEHSAIFQSMQQKDSVRNIILTASGGPFRQFTKEQLQNVELKDALKHPTWNMGGKITIDSASMINKGLEVIEAHHLFGISYDRIKVVVHPQSIIHSMVEYEDSSIIAQIGVPSMKVPISYAINYPQRDKLNQPLNLLDKDLTFEKPNDSLEGLNIAVRAGKTGGSMPCAMNAANEIAVAKFLKAQIKFLDIYRIINRVMKEHKLVQKPSLEQLYETDIWARKKAVEII